MKKLKFIDLFCGVGGFHLALKEFDAECVFASDIDADCRQVYKNNFGLEPYGDITKVNEKAIPPHDIICAGFPCQAFSKAGYRKGVSDPRGTLFYEIVRIAKQHQPKYLILENVRNLAGHDGGNTWKVIRHNLREIGYNVSDEPIIFSPHYLGIPQHRERVFILCKRKDLGDLPAFSFDKKSKPTSDAFSVLQPDNEIENIKKYKLNKREIALIDLWNEFVSIVKENLPGFPVWSEWLKEIDGTDNIHSYPKWKQDFIYKNSNLFGSNKKSMHKWLQKAMANPDFNGAKAKFEWQAGKTNEPNLWDTIMHFRPSGLRAKAPTHYPALVAITQTSIIGPRKRRLTPRECARLQSIPDNYQLHPTDRIAYKQLGNSVNVDVVKLFAKLLLSK
ncbi:MAG TPA: DNA (cytosine-5-)-methyltransferase [Bacteroidales bacterium]|nr:DNA (cytosine-5-)-methyltransferase [Bacteroidales bacterium]